MQRLALLAAFPCLVLAAATLPVPDGPSAAAEGPALLEEPEPAIGRVNHAGYRRRRHCTVFAIAPRVAVTAAHCLEGIDPAGMHLLFGYARMEWLHHASPLGAHDLGNDVSVLCLGEDAPDAFSPSARDVSRGDIVRVVGYGRPRVHAQGASRCTVAAIVGDDLHLDCPQSPGASGAPVLDEAGSVVGVMSRSSSDLSVASRLPDGAAEACP